MSEYLKSLTHIEVKKAKQLLNNVVLTTPLTPCLNLSQEFNCDVLLKREDLQVVRSYKLRGAYNKIKSLPEDILSKGIVCASAGNHAQGVAFSCNKLGINARIYMPATTPKQKINQVKMFGQENVEIILIGDTYDDSFNEAQKYCEENGTAIIHPFDDLKIIEGQATVGVEMLQQTDKHIDYLFVPIGGGGLISGVGSYFKQVSPETKIIGVEPLGAPSMKESLKSGNVVKLEKINKFVDGASVQEVGQITFDICKDVVDDILLVHEGKICSTILKLYNENAIVVEPAGALAIAALEQYRDEIKGKTVACIVSGSNNDITRTEEIKERSLLYEGVKHYFVVRFPQRSGALKEFVNDVLNDGDDITYFQYSKKNSREKGPAVIGVELQNPENKAELFKRMEDKGFVYEYLNDKDDMFQLLI